MCVYMHSRFVENHPIRILEDEPLISEGVLSQSCNHLQPYRERVICVVKKRFPILKVRTFYPIESQIKIIVVVVVLHNIIKSWNGEEGWLDQLPSKTQPSQYVNVPDGDFNYATNSGSIDGNS
jgi:hypothetical protein